MAKMIVLKNIATGPVVVNGQYLEPGETRAVDERLAKRLLKERPKDLARASGEERESALEAADAERTDLEVEPITAEELAARERALRESDAPAVFGAAATPAGPGWEAGVAEARAEKETPAASATASDLRSAETKASTATPAKLRSDETKATGRKG